MGINPSLISFVAMGKRRKDILLNLSKKSMSQPEIRKITGMYKSHTSRTLAELTKKKLIVCRNPNDKAFRFYKITSLGIKIIKEVQRIVE